MRAGFLAPAIAIFGGFVCVASAPKPIALAVSPRVSLAPATLVCRVRVHAEPEDRWIVVAADSGEFETVSGWPVDSNRTLYTVTWPDLPAGEYDIVARVGHDEHVRATDRAVVIIATVGP